MASIKTLGALLAVLVVASGAAAAAPGNAPADAPVENDSSDAQAQDQMREETANSSEANDTESDEPETDSDEEDRAGERPEQAGPPEAVDDRRGPPVNMPAQVPGFVSDVHQIVTEHLAGGIDGLGERIGDLTPGGDEADADADDPARPDDASLTVRGSPR